MRHTGPTVGAPPSRSGGGARTWHLPADHAPFCHAHPQTTPPLVPGLPGAAAGEGGAASVGARRCVVRRVGSGWVGSGGSGRGARPPLLPSYNYPGLSGGTGLWVRPEAGFE